MARRRIDVVQPPATQCFANRPYHRSRGSGCHRAGAECCMDRSLAPEDTGWPAVRAESEMSGATRAAAGHDPRSYTPDKLAERMLAAGRALEGERKVVTVLFVDVVGSLELAEQLDPEEWRRVMDRCF